MSRPVHRPCPWRQRRKFGGTMRDYCTINAGNHPPDAPFCEYCSDRRQPVRKQINPNRKAKR